MENSVRLVQNMFNVKNPILHKEISLSPTRPLIRQAVGTFLFRHRDNDGATESMCRSFIQNCFTPLTVFYLLASTSVGDSIPMATFLGNYRFWLSHSHQPDVLKEQLSLLLQKKPLSTWSGTFPNSRGSFRTSKYQDLTTASSQGLTKNFSKNR